MVARFVYWMNVSLDLFIEREAGEHGDIEGPSWMRLGESLHREFNIVARGMSALVEGRTVYEMMDPFWPNARTDESLPGFLREFGNVWTAIPKVLVSRTRMTADHNTRIICGDNDAIGQLASERSRGGSLPQWAVLVSSACTAQYSKMRAGLPILGIGCA